MHFESKGWGWERWIVNKDLYCGKLLYVAKGRKCSIHYHKNKDETFYLHSGRVEIFYSDELEKILENTTDGRYKTTYIDFPLEQILKKVILEPGDNFYVPPGRIHQFVGLLDSEMFEFSTTHEESDSYRIVKGD